MPDSDAFDETSFDFSITRGGSCPEDANLEHIHTGIIIANASYREGENVGLPVPLHCTWYNVSQESSELVKIPNVTGACY